jgi:hypothetical protein
MKNARTEMEDFLREMDQYHRTINFRGLPALLLAGGHWFQGRASSDGYDCARQWKNKHPPTAQACYYNAQSFCLDHEEARYFEGYALFTGLGLPAEHAWTAMADGTVVDFTLETAELMGKQELLPFETRDTLYVGLEVPTEFIREAMLTRKWFDSLAEEFSERQRERSASHSRG